MNLLSSPLLTDLYQLTMLQAYYEAGMTEQAVFELFVRKLPRGRNFFVAAGLEQAIEFLDGLRFTEEELAWIRASGLFKPEFAARLEELRFTGDVHALPEGTVFFPNEPILRVTAPMPEAQLVESRLVNLVHFEVLVASKAARCVLAAPGKRLVDFGLRRAHGAEAGLLAARAAYLAGFDGTATTIASPRFGIPVYGTMAHSFVQAHESESAAFAHFARAFPRTALLLIDTYDTVAGARKVAALAPSWRARASPCAAYDSIAATSGRWRARCGACSMTRAATDDDLRERQSRRASRARSGLLRCTDRWLWYRDEPRHF